MNIGAFLIYVALMSSLGAAISFFRDGRSSQRSSAISLMGNRLYLVMGAAVLIASILLLTFLLSHEFQYEYIAKYSSRSLPLVSVISAFWAGQEGTFLPLILPRQYGSFPQCCSASSSFV